MLFFFQAEDGIRDLVRSRGLGDVYKRQVIGKLLAQAVKLMILFAAIAPFIMMSFLLGGIDPVSYTHLTLPTSDLV